MTTPISEIFRTIRDGPDLTFMGPTDQCVCGCEVFHALVWFDDERAIAGYFTDMKCAHCGALVKGVTQAPDEVP